MSGEMHTEQLKREFVDKKTSMTFSDPNVIWTPDQVRNFLADQYPHLTNATIRGPKILKDKVQFEFETNIGVKG